jgi:2-keto-4-pentenoate hydratase
MSSTALLDDGVREQLRTLHGRLASGMPRAGWKICINDARMQAKLGLERSFVGFLNGSRALADGGTWSVEEGSMLGVEPEFAIRFSKPVPASAGPDEVRSAIAGVAPAIEVVDWKGAKFDLGSIAAASSFHAGFVVGELRPLSDVPAIDDICPLFRRGDEIVGAPDPALVPSDLTVLVREVAEFLGRFDESIEVGDWLLCGACTNPARVEPGDEIEADFASLGRVRVRFSG